MSDNINVWYHKENDKEPRIFVAIRASGNIMLRPDGYDIVFFLTYHEADNLIFLLKSNLQDIKEGKIK